MNTHNAIHWMAINMDVALALCFWIVLRPKELANSVLYRYQNEHKIVQLALLYMSENKNPCTHQTLEDMEDMKLNHISTGSRSELIRAVS